MQTNTKNWFSHDKMAKLVKNVTKKNLNFTVTRSYFRVKLNTKFKITDVLRA